MEIVVREERPADERIVEELTRQAFSYPGRIERGKIGCPYEHWMVHELRGRDGVLPLSLVAEADGRIVGHIIGSRAAIKTADGTLPVLDFGPLSVLPEKQRQGVGSALLRALIDKAKRLGYGAILFFGRPEYYPRFGFQPASTFGVADEGGENYPAFMAMELQPGYLATARGGRFYESSIYNDALNRERVKTFDENFRQTP